MKKLILGLFKRCICLPTGVSLLLLSIFSIFPFMIPHLLYWMITGRSMFNDALNLIDYSLT